MMDYGRGPQFFKFCRGCLATSASTSDKHKTLIFVFPKSPNDMFVKGKLPAKRMGKKVKKEPEPLPKDAFDPLPIESKNAATVVLMLNSPEQEVLSKACEAIYRFAEKGDENTTSLMSLGAVEPLARLISHEDKTVRRNAFMSLGVMASNNDVKRLMKKLNVIPSIINKLSPEEDMVIHEYATLCLAFLSVDFTCKIQIYDNNGLRPLLHLLSSPDPDVQKNSVECVCNLVKDFSSRVAVRELSGLAPLLELLRSEFPVIQKLALHTLESITTDSKTRAAFREEQGFNTLLEFLTTKEFSDLHVDALAVMSNCLEDVESTRSIQSTGGLETLLQFVTTAGPPGVQAKAVQAISRLAQSSENRKILHEQDLEKALVNLLAVENDGVRTAVCQGVAAMSQLLASRDTFRHLDGLRPIVRLMSCEGSDVREAAAHALSSLTHGNQPNAYAVCEADGDELVVQLLQEGRPAIVPHAAALLTHLACHEPLRDRLLTHGAMQALAELLHSSHTRVLASVTRAVAELACDAEGRAELRNVGGLAPLVTLLKSNHAEIRQNVCWAVSVCANDEPTATEMCKLGALEVLQEINYSVNLGNKFSTLALQKLLDSNLSVKYSLTGRLSSTDITADGFYDSGQAKVGYGVPALEDAAKQVINQHRAVIVVNGKPPDRKVKSWGRWEDEKQRDEDEYKTQHEAPVMKPWAVPNDPTFRNLVREAASTTLPLHNQAEMYSALAKLVCVAMGGPVDIAKQHDFLWELPISELNLEVQSNVIPIGKIKKGTYYHRALLFKALADRIGLTCSLVRGSYSRAWNEVLLSCTPTNAPTFHPQTKSFVVDLMHNPGNLLKCGTPAAIQYQMI